MRNQKIDSDLRISVRDIASHLAFGRLGSARLSRR